MNMVAEKIKLKTHSHVLGNVILSTPPFVYPTLVHKEKPQGRIGRRLEGINMRFAKKNVSEKQIMLYSFLLFN